MHKFLLNFGTYTSKPQNLTTKRNQILLFQINLTIYVQDKILKKK